MKKQVHIQVFFLFMKYPQVFFQHVYFLCIIMSHSRGFIFTVTQIKKLPDGFRKLFFSLYVLFFYDI